ncbi:hypothetical protein GGF38_002882, partial [Coemansia sp. RSA 25]
PEEDEPLLIFYKDQASQIVDQSTCFVCCKLRTFKYIDREFGPSPTLVYKYFYQLAELCSNPDPVSWEKAKELLKAFKDVLETK